MRSPTTHGVTAKKRLKQGRRQSAVGMIGIAIIIDIFSALRRKKYDEYQIIALEKIMLFNGLFITIIFPFSLFILIFAPIYFVETIFAFILFQWLCMVITEVLYLFKNYKI